MAEALLPVVKGDENAADDLVHRGPLHTVEPLEVPSQRSADLRGFLGGRGAQLDMHPALVDQTRRVRRASGGSAMPCAASTMCRM